MTHVSKFSVGLVGLSLSLEILLGLGLQNSAQASECQPPTPCPCAADGTCHPKRDTWGNYKTHWRPWPGDKVGLNPTKAEETESEIKRQLPSYQPPRPEQEELRGPAKKTPAADTAKPAATEAPGQAAPGQAAPDQAAPAEEGAEPAGQKEFELPGLPGIPDFDPQGALPQRKPQPLPQIEDGPPALPENLSAALAVTPYYLAPESQPSTGPTVVANQSHAAPIPSESGTVVQATVELQPVSDIQLTNPAATNIYKPTDEDLHQAIYIETSDIPANN